MMKPFLFTIAALALSHCVNCRTITLYNDRPRRAVDGSYVDAHDGLILEHSGTYFLYGESYGNQTLATPYPWANHPRLSVYTSTDMMSWTYRGEPLPMIPGTLWIPNVIWHEKTQRFIMWYGAGGWRSATSLDGINFTPERRFVSRFGAKAGTDGTGMFIDDDGIGYVVFASSPPGFDEPGHRKWPGHPNAHGYGHIVSIERMASDLLSSSLVNVSDLFPDDYVESPSLFKRKGIYYVTYGSCCCGCAQGGGIVIFTSKSIHGPWIRQAPYSDINCRNSTALVCGGYGLRHEELGDLVFNAQWWGPSFIPLADGTTSVMFVGRRWLSGENHPTGCNDICGNAGKAELCVSSNYYLKSDLSVWYPLEFDATGAILPMRPMPSFTLELPDLQEEPTLV